MTTADNLGQPPKQCACGQLPHKGWCDENSDSVYSRQAIASGRLIGIARILKTYAKVYGSLEAVPIGNLRQCCLDIIRYADEVQQ